MKIKRKKLALTALTVSAFLTLSGCNFKEQAEEILAPVFSIQQLIQEPIQHIKQIPDQVKSFDLFQEMNLFKKLEIFSPTTAKNKAEVLKGYDAIVKKTDRIMKPYLDEEGTVSEEELTVLSDKLYDYAQQLKQEGAIQSFSRSEESGSVTMVLDTGARILFAPTLTDTYSGSYSVNTVNAVGFRETVPAAVVFNGTKSVKDYGEYIQTTMEDCTQWNHLDDQQVTVSAVRTMLENASADNCRLIFWRGHGNISEGESVLALPEPVNDNTSRLYEEDIQNGDLIVGSQTYWITPGFIEKYMSEVSNGGLFFCGSCYSAADGGDLAYAFIDNGFQAFVGTDGSVINIYSDWIMKAVAENLCEEDSNSPGDTMTIRSALLKAKNDKGEQDISNVTFRLYEQVHAKEQQVPGRTGIVTPQFLRTDALSYIEHQSLQKTRTIKPFRLLENNTLNNGGTVVRYQGNDYYWKYSSDSKNNDGLFTFFSNRNEVENQMVCRHADGREEVLFTAVGVGRFYIIGGRIYAGFSTGESIYNLYSVNLDGTDRRDYGEFQGICVNEEETLFLGRQKDQWCLLNLHTGDIQQIAGNEFNYIDILENCIYFSYVDENKNVILYQYPLDGTNTMKEIDRIPAIEDWLWTQILQIMKLDQTLYYSYGAYAGTGGFFQTGGIRFAELDESGNPIQCGTAIDQITGEEFQVEKTDDSVNLYYISSNEYGSSYIGFWDDDAYESCQVKNMTTGAVTDSSFPLSRPESYVLLNGEIAAIEKNKASYKTLIPASLISEYGCQNEIDTSGGKAVMIRDLEIVGEDIYYTVEESLHSKEHDFGWRPGYLRQKSSVYRLKIGSEQAELIFSY